LSRFGIQAIEGGEQPGINFEMLKPGEERNLIGQEGRHDRFPKRFLISLIDLQDRGGKSLEGRFPVHSITPFSG
jgi:hypothetical protein